MNQWFHLLLAASTLTALVASHDKPSGVSAPPAKAPIDLNSDPFADVPRDKVAYNMGRTLGKNMADVEIKPDLEAYMQGVRDGLAGAPSKYKEEDMAEAVKKFKATLPTDDQLKKRKAIREGKAYLEKNRKRQGVTETPSGLQYEVLKAADGPKPKASDMVKVHYHGTLLDGTVFDSSIDRKSPITFPLDGVIAGWTEGVLLMNKGSKYRFVIPDKLAYGDQGQGSVGPNQTLVFEVELLDINPPDAKPPSSAQ